MEKITEYTLTITNVGNNTRIKTNEDGSITICMDMLNDDIPKVITTAGITFVRVNVESLTLHDDWLFYKPQTKEQQKFKETVEEILKNQTVKNFFIPKNYWKEVKFFNQPLNWTGVGSTSCNSWIHSAHKNEHEMLRYSQYIMLLAWMLKKMTETVCSLNEAWEKICDDSISLTEINWESTFGFQSFMGSKKFLLPDDPEDKGCYIAEGGGHYYHYKEPLAKIHHDFRRDVSLENHPYVCYGLVCKL